MMRLLVTGASGFLGSRIANSLSTDGHTITALLRKHSDSTNISSSISLERHDGSTDQLADVLKSACPDAVIHTSSMFVAEHQAEDVAGLIRANVEFGAQLLEAMRISGSNTLVNFGTSWQHFQTSGDKRDLYRPATLYAATKQAFEAIVLFYADAYGLRGMTLKLSDTYGPDDWRGKLVPSLLRQLRDGCGGLALSPGHQALNLTHVDDVVGATRVALKRACQLPASTVESFSIRGLETISLRDLVSLLEELSGRSLNAQFGARPYRSREVMKIWEGDLLPSWRPGITLRQGLSGLLRDLG